MDVVDDKNPRDLYGKTPLHRATETGHDEICKMIMEMMSEE